MPKHRMLDYDEIVDGIYIGSNQCCQTHFDQMLLDHRLTADISLEEDRIDAPFGVEAYLWLPVKDHTPPSKDQFKLGISTLKQLIQMKKRVYVHCKNGHGRAPTLVAAYLIQQKGMRINDAIGFIKEKRPTIHLQPSQRKALQKFTHA